MDNSNLSIGALREDSFIAYRYAVDILVAQNPHFHNDWQFHWCLEYEKPSLVNGFNYGLG